MPNSQVAVAKRALVKLLVYFAAVYSIVLECFTRDSPDKEVEKVFRRVPRTPGVPALASS